MTVVITNRTMNPHMNHFVVVLHADRELALAACALPNQISAFALLFQQIFRLRSTRANVKKS